MTFASVGAVGGSSTAGIDRTRLHHGFPLTTANVNLFGVMNRLASGVADIFVAGLILIFESSAGHVTVCCFVTGTLGLHTLFFVAGLVDRFFNREADVLVGGFVTGTFRFDTFFTIAGLVDRSFGFNALFFVAGLIDFAFAFVGFGTVASLINLLLAADGNLFHDGIVDFHFFDVVLSVPNRLFHHLVFDAAIARFAKQTARNNSVIGTVIVTSGTAVAGICLSRSQADKQGQDNCNSEKALHSQVPQFF